MLVQTQVGQQQVSKGSNIPMRGGNLGDVIISELHGKFYEQTYNGNMYSSGVGTPFTTAAATYSTATLGATATPILGIWNPLSSTINAVILQARLAIIMSSLTATGTSFSWCVSTGNGVISTGTLPFNRKTLIQTGSQCKGLSNIALTGLTNNLVVMEGSALFGGTPYNTSFVGTAVGAPPAPAVAIDDINGAIIIPPGGVLALLATTNNPVALSASTSLLWEEVPL